MKASPGARSWMAAGVRHELLTRALPALRHDMTAPVSVIRMALLLLKRQSANPSFDSSSWEERVGVIEEQLKALVGGVHSLRDWELAADDEGITRGALVAGCTGLMRAAFELNGIGFHVGEGLEPKDGDTVFPSGAALRYLFLGALGFLHDGVPELGALAVEAQGADGLRFVATTGDSATPDPMTGALRAPRTLAIDAIALQALADDLGYEVQVERDSVSFLLAQG